MGCCSGIPTITEDLGIILNFSITDAIDGVGLNRKIVQLQFESITGIIDVPESNIHIIGANNNIYSLKIDNAEIKLPKNTVSNSLPISVNLFDVYGNIVNIPNLTTLNLNYAYGLSEKERARSGTGLYPLYMPNVEDMCGSYYESAKSLATEYTTELMKSARILNDEVVYEYSWPNGVYNTFDTVIDYSGTLPSDEIELNEETVNYRWVTLTKCWNGEDFETIKLDETTGFTLNINVSSDVKDLFIVDDYSMETMPGELIVQAKVIDTTKDNINVTEWFDCNKPYNGFAEVGTVNGQGAMYAGTSSALSKRITFGTKVYSGTLIFRVGIKEGSNLKIQSLTVKDLI